MTTMAFIRTKEDFSCEHCGAAVHGDGFTNHCPQCLWSKHVDVDPGDRAHSCRGLMRPVRLEGNTPSYTIVHRCEVCGAERRVRTARTDNPESLLALAGHNSALD